MNTPSNPYLDQFFALKRAPEFVASRVLPRRNASKELTEVMGAFAAVRCAVGAARFGDPEVLLLDVGCGHAPRAAAFFALMTRWTCIGIDPAVSRQARGVPRCDIRKKRLDAFLSEEPLHYWPAVVVVGVHSHALLQPALSIGASEMHCVAIPCCVPQELAEPPHTVYEDPHIMSEQRTVKIWSNP